jgi:hypothetical protein
MKGLRKTVTKVRVVDVAALIDRAPQEDETDTFVFVFCVGPAVTHRMYCSLPRLIVLTPL